MKLGSLFAGIGGFDLGFERAGIETAWQVEIDPMCRAVLAQHFPNTERFEDVRDVGQGPLSSVELICGGFPCQDLSVAGSREGLAGSRSGLWYEFHRIIRELLPRWVVIENVPGLLSSDGGRDFAVLLGGLAGVIPGIPDGGWKRAGFVRGRRDAYGVAWRVLDSRYFNVPQRRERVFIVGSFGNGRAVEILFERDGGVGDFAQSKAEESQIANALTSGAGGYRYATEETLIPVVTSLTWRDGVSPDDNTAQGGKIIAFNHQSGGDLRLGVSVDLANTLQKSQVQAVAGTIDVRRMTPVECERLQAFPAMWTGVIRDFAIRLNNESIAYLRTHYERAYGECLDDDQVRQIMSDSVRYQMLGNAVTVSVAEWIGRRIVAVEREEEAA